MSDDELEKYVSLWSVKHAQAREQATSELEGLRVETQEQIAQLRADAEAELEEYRITWQEELSQLEEDTANQLASLRQEFAENVGLIKKDTEAEMPGNDRGGHEDPEGSRMDRDGTADPRRSCGGRLPVEIRLSR